MFDIPMHIQFSVIVYFIAAILLFAIKHGFADFYFQNRYMLGKFEQYPKFILPLAAHCGIHALFTFVIFIGAGFANYGFVEILSFASVWAVYDFFTHFLVDLVKAQLTRIKGWSHDDKEYWFAIGLDQFAHTVFSIPMIITLVMVYQRF